MQKQTKKKLQSKKPSGLMLIKMAIVVVVMAVAGQGLLRYGAASDDIHVPHTPDQGYNHPPESFSSTETSSPVPVGYTDTPATPPSMDTSPDTAAQSPFPEAASPVPPLAEDNTTVTPGQAFKIPFWTDEYGVRLLPMLAKVIGTLLLVGSLMLLAQWAQRYRQFHMARASISLPAGQRFFVGGARNSAPKEPGVVIAPPAPAADELAKPPSVVVYGPEGLQPLQSIQNNDNSPKIIHSGQGQA